MREFIRKPKGGILMAVTAPTPPTPPTPPTVPQVTMDGGGTVTETTSPTTAISNLEAQARAAVARGEGALTRVMNGDGEGSDGSDGSNASSTSNPSNASNNANGNGANAQAGQQKNGQQQAQNAQQGAQVVAADGAGNPLTGQDDDAQSAKAMQALEEGRSHSQASSLGGHGVLYIGFSVVAFVVLAVVAFRWLQNRRKERGSLHFGDFADEGGDWRAQAKRGDVRRTDAQDANGSETDESLRGRTAGEILGDIEREEERQLAIARKRAEEYKRQQARDAAARERRKEEREEAAARKAREALHAQQAQERKKSVIKKDEDDQPHFDLRA